ncbi:hypothetical protein RAA17_01210 [Komagataeibacter rhaeticus]|nr:hypothetical protein [Komagataeibacter rhaeticus]
MAPAPANPVRRDIHSARPGGTPVVMEDGTIILPTQDCARTYGGAITPLAITTLTTQEFAAHPLRALHAPAAWRPATDGLHTLSAAGRVTLVDAKHTSRSVIRRAGWISPASRVNLLAPCCVRAARPRGACQDGMRTGVKSCREFNVILISSIT